MPPQAPPTLPASPTAEPLRFTYRELAESLKTLYPQVAGEDDMELVYATVKLYPQLQQGMTDDVRAWELPGAPFAPVTPPKPRTITPPAPSGPAFEPPSPSELVGPPEVRALGRMLWAPARTLYGVTAAARRGEPLLAGTAREVLYGTGSFGQEVEAHPAVRQWAARIAAIGQAGGIRVLQSPRANALVAALATDIVTDPLVYIGPGAIQAVTRRMQQVLGRKVAAASAAEADRIAAEVARMLQQETHPRTAQDFLEMLERRGQPFVPVPPGRTPPPAVAGLLPERTPGSAVRVYPPGSRVDVLGGEDAARRIVVPSEGPPPTVPGARAGAATSEWGALNLTPEAPPMVPEQPPLGLGVGRRGQKGKGRRTMLGATEGIGGPTIETSPGGRPPTVEQPRLGDVWQPPTHDPDFPVFQEAYVRAQAEGFTGTAEDLWERFVRERVSLKGMLQAGEEAAAGEGPAGAGLLRAVAAQGGFSPYTYRQVMKGAKLKKVRQALDGISEIRNRTPGGGVAGVRGVIRSEGLTFDEMETILRGQGILQPNQSLIEAVQDASRRAGQALPLLNLSRWQGGLRDGWWRAYDGPPTMGQLPTPRQQQLVLENLDALADDLGAKAAEGGGDVDADAQAFFQAVDDLAVASGHVPPTLRGSMPGLEGTKLLKEIEAGRVPPGEVAARRGLHREAQKPPEVLPMPEGPPPVPDQLPSEFRMTAEEPTTIPPSFLDRLKGEEGIIVLDVLPGVRQADQLKRWLVRHEARHGQQAWWKQAKAAMDEGDHGKAWRIAAAASARSVAQAVPKFQAQDRATLTQARSASGLPPDVPLMSPAGMAKAAGPESFAAKQAKAIQQGATVNRLGILEPPPPTKPAPAATSSRLLGQNVVREILDSVDPEGIIWPSREVAEQFPEMRLYRQITERVLLGEVGSQAELEALLKLSGLELSQYFRQTVSSWGRGLALLRGWAAKNEQSLERMVQLQPFAGGLPADRTLDVIARGGRSADRGMAITAVLNGSEAKWTRKLTEETEETILSLPQGIVSASISLLLAKPVTALRNLIVAGGRYSLGAVDEALSAGFSWLMRDPIEAQQHMQQAIRLAKSAGAPGVMPAHPHALALQEMYDLTAETLSRAKPADVRHSLRVLLDAPDQGPMHAFLGRVGGADIKRGVIETPILRRVINPLLDPRNQAKITVLNRAQEFTVRSAVFDAVLRNQLEARGLDANRLLTSARPWEEIAFALGEDGTQVLDGILHQAAGTALDWTFASDALKGTFPAKLLDFLYHPFARAAVQTIQPFPRFNFVAVPRFLYDHSPLPIIDNLVRGVPRAFGFGAGKIGGPRMVLGIEAKKIQRMWLPELTEKRLLMQSAVSRYTAEAKAARQEVSRLTTAAKKAGAGDISASIGHAQDEMQSAVGRLVDAQEGVILLRRQIERMRGRLTALQSIGVPTPAQALARMVSGTAGLFGLAFFLRSQPAAKGLDWFEYAWEEGKKIDLRAYAPVVQYLFPADVLHDVYTSTDWERIPAAAAEIDSPFAWFQAFGQHYTGKYTPDRWSKEFARAFLSFSQASGTTLTLADYVAQPGFTWDKLGQAVIGTVGQMLARFTVPLQTISEVVGGVAQATAPFLPGKAGEVAQAVGEAETTARIAPPVTSETPFGPLAAPLANIPGVRDLIPPEISQTTGKAIAATDPLARALGGLTIRERDSVAELMKEVGVPASSVYLREIGIKGLDDRVAYHYSRSLKELLPQLTATPWFLGLPNAALRRDYLQRAMKLIKQVALARTMVEQGPQTVREARMPESERKRRRLYMEHLQKLSEELGPVPGMEEEPASVKREEEGPPRVPEF